jgi:hypothetical protein
VIGDGTGIHPKFLHLLDEIRNFAGPVEEGIMGMTMQMGKGL